MDRSSDQRRQRVPLSDEPFPTEIRDSRPVGHSVADDATLEGDEEQEAIEQFVERGELIEGDEEVFYLAGRWERLFAQLIDAVAIAAAFGLGVTNSVAMGVGLVVVLSILQVFLLSTQGQTVGKSLMKIKIVKAEDETNPGFFRAVMVRLVFASLLGVIPFFSLANYLFIFRDDYRCIHDHLAGTKVVEE